MSASVFAKKFDPPNIDVEQAITIAKKHLKDENIVAVENYIIQRAEFLNLYNEYEPAHWNIRWEHLPRIKGGWFEMKVYNDGNVKIYHGE